MKKKKRTKKMDRVNFDSREKKNFFTLMQTTIQPLCLNSSILGKKPSHQLSMALQDERVNYKNI